MDALADSNRLMREEKEGLQNAYTEFKAKCESLEKQIEPLQEKQRLNVNKIEALLVCIAFRCTFFVKEDCFLCLCE